MRVMSNTTEMTTIPELLKVLETTELAQGGVLSVYLDVSLGLAAGQSRLLGFRDGAESIRRELVASQAELESFEKAVDLVEKYLNTSKLKEESALAIFVGGTEGYFFVTPVPAGLGEEVAWGKTAQIGRLVQALDNFQRVTILLFDKEKTRLFTVFLGKIEERLSFVDDVPGKQATGGWFALSQKRYERHHEDHVLRHVKRTVRALMDELRRRPFDRLLLSGPDEAISFLQHHLPRPLTLRLAGRLNLELFATEAEVVKATLAAAEEEERKDELANVQALVEQPAPNRAEVGLDSTLGALYEGRVHRLFVAGGLDRNGWRCEDCGRVSADPGPCLTCSNPTVEIADLKEYAIAETLAGRGKVEIVSGTASDLLLEYGGMGAWTRY